MDTNVMPKFQIEQNPPFPPTPFPFYVPNNSLLFMQNFKIIRFHDHFIIIGLKKVTYC